MSHQSQLEKSKYRNWVKGGLAYTYLKEVIGGFTDEEKKEKCQERRNELYKSSGMKLEDTELTKCIDDILAILENNTELTAKLIKLKQQNFIITTHSEAEVCRDAKNCILYELNQGIKEAEEYISKKKSRFSVEPDGTTTKNIEKALEPLGENTNIDLRLEEIKDLIKQINGKQEEKDNYKQIGTRLSKIYQSIGLVEDVIDKLKKNLKYIQEKQDLQCSLVKLYQCHYIKTSLSPLNQEDNDTNINDVYVEPNMVVVETHKQQNDAGESRRETSGKQEDKPLRGYHDLFQTDGRENKAIYIVGDVGAGKSFFCKRMIQKWCKAATESSNESLTSDDSKANGTSRTSGNSNESPSDSDQKLGTNDEEEIRKFDFLFYIPLQKMSNYCKITDMTLDMCKDEGLATDVVKRVFELDLNSCLFIIDGLDEWSPDKRVDNVSHESNGLPSKQDIKPATVITLSRPSAKGMLNIKRSEIDQKVELKGICGSSVENFIQKYFSKLKEKDMSSESLMEKIRQSGLEHLANTPLFLQQLVWLYLKKTDFGKSVSSIYSQLVNLMFCWQQTKTDSSVSGNDCSNKADQYNQMTLPELLKILPRCERNKGLLISIAKVAFKSLTSETGKGYLSLSDLERDGVSKDDVSQLINLGILVGKKCYDETQISFIHFSYLEFFAAVYASCKFDEKRSGNNTSVLKEIFPEVKTAADILQVSNLLKMICGLCPFVIKEVSLYISDIVKSDDKLVRPDYFDLSGFSSLRQIEQLTLSFLSESDTVNKPMVHLSDVYIDISPGIALQSIILKSVISFVDFMCSNEEVWNWMTQLNKLQYLHLDSCMITHDQMDRLSLFIKDASLRCLSLYDVDCKETDCLGHSIDLSHQDSLQKLEIVNCDGIQISKINHDRLVEIQLSSTKTLDIELLRDFRHLTDLHLGEHISSMTYNKQVDSVVHTLDNLRTLTIECIVDEDLTVTPDMKNLERICLVDVNMTQEKWCVFVFSLLKLPQSVDVTIEDSTSYLDSLIKQEYASLKKKYDFVKLAGSLFELSEFSHEEFTLRTKKNIIIQ